MQRPRIGYDYIREIPEEADDAIVREFAGKPRAEIWRALGHLLEVGATRPLRKEDLARYRALTCVLYAELAGVGTLLLSMIFEALDQDSPDFWTMVRATWHSLALRDREALRELIGVEDRAHQSTIEQFAPTDFRQTARRSMAPDRATGAAKERRR